MLLIEEDRLNYNIEYSDEQISKISDIEYKNYVKKQVRKHSFDELKDIQKEHIKVKHIEYESLKSPQEYLVCGQFNNKLSSLLFNLRCQSVNGVKANFSNMYQGNTNCPFKCLNTEDTQKTRVMLP